MLQLDRIYLGDCLEVMKSISDESIDMVLADPPYGITNCKWDSVIPLEPLWEQLERIIKLNGAIVLFGSQPFTSILITSNIKMFKYEWIWEKGNPSNPASCNKMPLKYHENILVFYKKLPTYNKQMIPRKKEKDGKSVAYRHTKNYKNHKNKEEIKGDLDYVKDRKYDHYDPDFKNPKSVLQIYQLRPISKERVGHPTQKPIKLMEYLIKTYTNENETVLDFCIGSGTTAVACKNLNRHFIGIEIDEYYYNIAQERLGNDNTRIVMSVPI